MTLQSGRLYGSTPFQELIHQSRPEGIWIGIKRGRAQYGIETLWQLVKKLKGGAASVWKHSKGSSDQNGTPVTRSAMADSPEDNILREHGGDRADINFDVQIDCQIIRSPQKRFAEKNQCIESCYLNQFRKLIHGKSRDFFA